MLSLAQLRRPLAQAETSGLSHPKPWMLRGWGYHNDTGVTVDEKLALSLTSVFRAVDLISGHVASAPLKLYRKTAQGRIEPANHPLTDFIKAPGIDVRGFEFRQLVSAQVKLWGNSYWRITRDNRARPVSIEMLHPGLVTPKRVDGVRLYRYNNETLNHADVLHFMGMSEDGVKGVAPIQRAANAMGIGVVTEKFQGKFFSNGANVGAVLELPQGIRMGDGDDDNEVNQMLASFSKLAKGTDNTWKVIPLEPGMKFTKLDIPLEAIQFLQLKKYTVADVARLFGVPLHKLQELDRSTNNNIEHQAIEYMQDCLLPLTRSIESELNAKLLYESEKADYYFHFNLDFILRGDSKTRAEYYNKATAGAAWLTPDEVRVLEDSNLMGGAAGILHKQSNTQPITEAAA